MGKAFFFLAFLFYSCAAQASNHGGKTFKEGDVVPEIALPSLNGDTMKLSSLRGRMVLIDFWASWCAPCRENNATLYNLYEKFNKRNFKQGVGFEIFSVSLDQDKKDWLNAVKNDNLVWNNHVSDLKKWESPVAKQFGVTFIPFNILIDGNGKVIGVNLNPRDIKGYLKAGALRD